MQSMGYIKNMLSTKAKLLRLFQIRMQRAYFHHSKRQPLNIAKEENVNKAINDDQEILKIVCISDTHNKLKDQCFPGGSILIHAGDFTRNGFHQDISNFDSWMSRQSYQRKLCIAGNHEVSLDSKLMSQIVKNGTHLRYMNFDYTQVKGLFKNCEYLEDSSTSVNSYKIYGSPWTIGSTRWGFTIPKEMDHIETWNHIPQDVDILITHSPPYGILDKTEEGINIGSQGLREMVLQIKPIVHIFGHAHESYGYTMVEGIHFINASTCTRAQSPTNPAIVFSLEKSKDKYTKDSKGFKVESNLIAENLN